MEGKKRRRGGKLKRTELSRGVRASKKRIKERKK